ncbi:hypothetical protein B0J12DRAFT_688803 [Macrophomina phaseolina]|uniref:Uncharacterized protein n=1 Tax=Macrophomina phaseolina TaxID=35725 RepID=A0ABQ8FRC4_9PEZI|nr:hypothetical protein B0J12DRAFT_688803 [Macrophomina phaseolina]
MAWAFLTLVFGILTLVSSNLTFAAKSGKSDIIVANGYFSIGLLIHRNPSCLGTTRTRVADRPRNPTARVLVAAAGNIHQSSVSDG